MKQQASLRSKLRRDGSVRWWSVYEQRWLDGWEVPKRDLDQMAPVERDRVRVHMQKHLGKYKVTQERAKRRAAKKRGRRVRR